MESIDTDYFKGNSLLSYTNLLTLILKRFNVPLSEEELVRESLNKTDETTLTNQKYEKVRNKLMHPNDLADKRKNTSSESRIPN